MRLSAILSLCVACTFFTAVNLVHPAVACGEQYFGATPSLRRLAWHLLAFHTILSFPHLSSSPLPSPSTFRPSAR